MTIHMSCEHMFCSSHDCISLHLYIIEAESHIKLSEMVNHFHTLLNSRDYDTGIDIHCENGKNNPFHLRLKRCKLEYKV